VWRSIIRSVSGWVSTHSRINGNEDHDNDQILRAILAAAGYYYDSENFTHGFVFSSGVVGEIDQPGARQTVAFGINSVNGIAGY
jgi:hypothetical protein